jgi:hypothetical protein
MRYPHRFQAAWTVLVFLIVPFCALSVYAEEECAGDAVACEQESDVEVRQGSDEAAGPLPFRGTSIGLSSVVSARSFDRSLDPHYNPYFASVLSANASWWFGNRINLYGRIALSREWTQADGTTRADETLVSDTTLGINATNFWNVPVREGSIRCGVGFTFPTSLASEAQTLTLGITPSFSASRRFDVLDGLSLAYSFQWRKNIYDSTTSARETPLFSTCTTALGSCDPFVHTGVRNVDYRVVHGTSIGLGLVGGLSANVGLSLFEDRLMDVGEDSRISFMPQSPADSRYAVAFGAGLSWSIIPALTVGAGLQTAHGQLAPDSTYRQPFFNRYSTYMLDVSFDVAGFTSQLREE